MDIRQFRTELAEAFKAAGFERKKIKGSAATIWLLPGREIDREFWEDAIRRPWGFQLSGTLSIDVRAFRDWLTERFPRDQHGIFWSSLTSRHIANERDMLFGAERREPPYQDWVDVIRRRLAVLPDTIEGLLGAEREKTAADAAPSHVGRAIHVSLFAHHPLRSVGSCCTEQQRPGPGDGQSGLAFTAVSGCIGDIEQAGSGKAGGRAHAVQPHFG